MKKILVVAVAFACFSCSNVTEKARLMQKMYDECYGDTTGTYEEGAIAFLGATSKLSVQCHETKEQRDARIAARPKEKK